MMNFKLHDLICQIFECSGYYQTAYLIKFRILNEIHLFPLVYQGTDNATWQNAGS